MNFVQEVHFHPLLISSNHSDKKRFRPSPRFPMRTPRMVAPLKSARHVHPTLFRFFALRNEISLDIRNGVPTHTALKNVADNFPFHYKERPAKYDRYNRRPVEIQGNFLNLNVEKIEDIVDNEGAWEVATIVIQDESGPLTSLFSRPIEVSSATWGLNWGIPLRKAFFPRRQLPNSAPFPGKAAFS